MARSSNFHGGKNLVPSVTSSAKDTSTSSAPINHPSLPLFLEKRATSSQAHPGHCPGLEGFLGFRWGSLPGSQEAWDLVIKEM